MSSTLWSLEVDHSAPATYLADEALRREASKAGLSPSVVRSALAADRAQGPFTLELVAPNGTSLYEQSVPVGDMLLFNWLPIFSERAYQLLIDEGCDADEFIDCRLRVLGNTPFKIHVPVQSYDVIDFTRSVALHALPLDPPIPFHFVSAYLKAVTPNLPPCFRVPAPGHPQVLSELFAQDNLREAWSVAGLKGAFFRCLAHGAA